MVDACNSNKSNLKKRLGRQELIFKFSSKFHKCWKRCAPPPMDYFLFHVFCAMNNSQGGGHTFSNIYEISMTSLIPNIYEKVIEIEFKSFDPFFRLFYIVNLCIHHGDVRISVTRAPLTKPRIRLDSQDTHPWDSDLLLSLQLYLF